MGGTMPETGGIRPHRGRITFFGILLYLEFAGM
jgi:hypothetical protein